MWNSFNKFRAFGKAIYYHNNWNCKKIGDQSLF
jgi:hypothetical protein